jgi:hypothetical protein
MRKSILKPRIRIAVSGWMVACTLAAAISAIAQDAPQSNFPTIPAALEKQLAARASDVKEVTLNKTMLSFGSQFLNSKQQDERQARQLIQNLDAIYIRKYDFDRPGAYTKKDVKEIQDQFAGPEWSPIIRKSAKGEGTKDIYFKLLNGQIHGIAILKAEPRELVLIDISGLINASDLGDLTGNFGIPNINPDKGAGKAPKGYSK